MVPLSFTSIDVDAWALAFATLVTLISVALAGLSAAHVTQLDRANDEEDRSWVVAFAERAKQKVESACPRLTKALSSTPNSKNSYLGSPNDSSMPTTKVSSSCLSSPTRRR